MRICAVRRYLGAERVQKLPSGGVAQTDLCTWVVHGPGPPSLKRGRGQTAHKPHGSEWGLCAGTTGQIPLNATKSLGRGS